MRLLNVNKRIWMEMDEEKQKQATRWRNSPIIRRKEYVLRLRIHVAEGVDPVSKYPNVTSRSYKVCAWIKPEDRYVTERVNGQRRVKFEKELDIPFHNDEDVPLETNFVSLEVARLGSFIDPGPSRGQVVVGRVRLALPKAEYSKKSGRFGLVRLVEGQIVGEGHIDVTMKVIPSY